MTFEQFFRILMARKWLAIGLFLSILCAAILLGLLLPKSYTAETSIVVDLKPDPITGMVQSATLQPSAHIATQVNMIRSDAVARRVVGMLKLGDNAEMRSKWIKETDQRGSFEDWLGKTLLKGLSVSVVRESSIIRLQYESVSPQFAAVLANAFARAYTDTVVELRTSPARGYSDYFEERARLAREKLERAQAKLTEAQRARGIVTTDERMDLEMARLNELGSQVVSLKALLAESSNRSAAGTNRADITAEAITNPVIGGLRTEIARQTAQLNQLSQNLGDEHPTLKQTRASIAELERKLNAEVGRVSGGLRTADTIVRARLEAAQKGYDEQRARILEMKGKRDGVALLEREVESAQRVLEAIQLRLSQTNLESNANQASAYVLSPAVEPPKHSWPNMFIFLAVGLFGGAIAALFTTLAAELLDRRIRTATDLIHALEIPVIGVLPSPMPKRLKLFNKRTTYNRMLPAAPN